MIEKTGQLMSSLLFVSYDKDKDNSDLLNKIVFNAATTSSQEISLAANKLVQFTQNLVKVKEKKYSLDFENLSNKWH